MTTLVTGGAGYIGAITVRALRRTGRDVVVLDSLDTGDAASVSDAELVVGDIADAPLVEDLCRRRRVEEIVHFAAHKAVAESMRNPGRYFGNNVVGSARLIEAASAAGVGRIVFSSSAAVYGTPDSVPVDEKAPVRCESVYAETKAMVERILGWYDATHGVRSVSLRYFNAAGASDDGLLGERWDRSQNLMPHVMKALLGASPHLEIFGDDYPTADGTCVRDYIHVEDLAVAHVAALDHLVRGGETMTCNVGTGRGTSVREIVAATERITRRPVPTVIGPRRAGDPAACYADVTRAREVLGFTAVRPLDAVISSALAWHEGRGADR